MSSTKEEQLAQLMGALFDEVLLPIAERMQAAGVQAFPLAPDVTWLSYYVRRRRSAMSHDDFTSAACADTAQLEQRLGAHWRSLGRHELAGHAARFAAAAQAARPLLAAGEAAGEPSPYVYAMF
ncbi:hypothetical protein ACFSQU_20970 [Massilia sp. GCM10020059]|uniref:Uncharacterized protein n=1 Tax=Massilia agrisoli TaxID=2892444 RepID=A0ABS8ITS5_9BURK|nr:hypothetical protein [Massilia agrisoli]MCC6072009.1 hypothetical protein [Massilia agrisoli]